MSTNPLAKHFRTPALYIKLPSKGRWWPDGSLELPVTGEIPVYPMTTRDEITLRTPDALLNGEGVAKVIESCCPNIKDAWKMPSIDVDAVLVAIRIASYGPSMTLTNICSECGDISDYESDLQAVSDSIPSPTYGVVKIGDLKIKLKPQDYASLNLANRLAFEEQRMLKFIIEDTSEGDERAKKFQENLDRLVEASITVVTDSTDYIEDEEGNRVTDKQFIQEYYEKVSGKEMGAVREELLKIKELMEIKPLDVECPSCHHKHKLKVEFNYTSFFDPGS